MIVLDSSAYVEAIHRPLSDPLNRRMADAPVVHVPDVFDVEVFNALRSLCIRGSRSEESVRGALNALSGWRQVERHRVTPLFTAMWGLRDNLSGQDACYAALAGVLRVPLVTADARISRVGGLPCQVELV